MGKKRPARSSIPFAFLVLVLAGAATAAFIVYRNATPTPPPAQSIEHNTPEPTTIVHPPEKRRQVDIYVMRIVADEVILVAEKREVLASEDPHRAALEKLLLTNREEGESRYLIPTGTRLLGFEIRDDIAYVNLSKEIRQNFTGGSEVEELLVDAIVSTVGQFDDVGKVQILIGGSVLESIGGHVDVSRPIDLTTAPSVETSEAQ